MDDLMQLVFDRDEAIRLDVFVTQRVPQLSRSRVQGLIESGNITVGNEVVNKNSFLLTDKGQVIDIRVPHAEPIGIEPEKVLLDILFENDDVIVINKPAGMVMHPSAGHHSGTLVHAALGYDAFLDGIGGKMRPGIVHRLDKDTSGVVLVAKNDLAYQWFQKQFKDRATDKEYIALVDTHPPTLKGKIEAPIYRDPKNRKKMTIAPEGKGKMAITIFYTLKQLDRHSLLKVNILTGRTHQIRVHLASIGSPVTGDTMYGFATPTLTINRHFLHAKTLGICLPGETSKTVFSAELPDELANILKELGS
jgi:23S rRNA pseudouridine1911/1915/1917 synthase